MTSNTDILVTRASAGDALAIEELLVRELPRLRTFVRLRSGPRIRRHESASDLVQSVCRELLEELPDQQYRGEAAFRAWLYTAALRKILDRDRYWSRQKRDVGREVAAPHWEGADLLADYGHVFTPSRRAIAQEELARLEDAFDELSDEQREVVTLVRIVGLSHREVAERLGRPESWCRTQLSRALARISLALDP